MSKPASRLSSFRSYSYYHVLVMCDSTYTADRLAESTQPDVWHHTTDETRAADSRPNTPNLGKYSPKCVLDENGQCVGRYIVLIDGASDAAFAINQVKVTSATAAGAVPYDLNTSLAVEGSLAISEPKGVAFLDQVVKCSIALGVDNSQVVYALKTFFVGYKYDDEYGDIPFSINDIPPVNFITYDVTGSFTEQGGTYEMLFVAVANGASRLPQYSKAVSSMNFKSGKNLKDTFDNLQAAIRANYDRYYNCVLAQLASLGTPESTALIDSLREVKYTIDVEEPYTSDSYVVTDGPVQYKDTGSCSEPVTWSFSPNSSIESAIATIMTRCDKVQKEMNTGDPASGVKYEYKIHSCVKSTPVSGSDASTGKLQYEVKYSIKQIPTPKTIANDTEFAKFAQDEEQLRNDPLYNKLHKNVIEFDYIYTGNNTDILEFDIKVNMGLAYLQTATLSNTFKGQLESAPALAQNISNQSAHPTMNGRFVPGERPLQTPVFFGKQIVHPKLLNRNDASSATQGAYTLAKHASLEVAEATMRIAGNDRLLATTNKATSAAAMEAGEPQLVDVPDDAREADFKYWNYVPAYAKINIKMPRDNDDFALFTGQTSDDGTSITASTDYARDFWFDGYYYVVGIEHVFENGEFTQTLDMISIPKTSAFGSTKGSKEPSFDIKLDECYDSKTGCGKTPAAIPTIAAADAARVSEPPPQKPIGHQDHNAQNANSILKNATSLSKIKGWDGTYVGKDANGNTETITISKEVKAAILQAGADKGVDPMLLAQMCYQESKFRPNATNPSSATGLFQFVSTTWTDLKPDGPLTRSVISNLDSRYDPYLNSYAAARYVELNTKTLQTSMGSSFTPTSADLYLAHFAGPNGAAWIIQADQATGGTATLKEAYGENTRSLARMIKQNSPYIKESMTTREVRTWAASKLAWAMIDPITPVQPQPHNVSLADTLLIPGEITRQTIKQNIPAAKDKVSAQQDCKVQDEKAKEDKQPCTNTPESGATTVTPQKNLSAEAQYIAKDRKARPERYNSDGTCAPGYVATGHFGCQPIKK